MEVQQHMDPLHFLTKEELIRFFHCKKTEMSCMEQPHIFLHQLRDHNLVPEKLYKKVINMKSKERRKDGVYKILDWLERERADSVKLFWQCVFRDHILQEYPVLCLLRNSLLDGSFKVYERLPDPEDQTEREKEQTVAKDVPEKEKKGGKKRKESTDETEGNEQPGPSTPNQKKPAKKPVYSSPVKKGEKQEIWTWGLYKNTLPVTCGHRKGTLNRDKLGRGEPCIFSQRQWFTPSGFENFAGKSKNKNWKTSIRCQKTPLQKLLQEGHLLSPHKKRRCVKKNQKVLFHDISSESSSPVSESSVEMEGSDEEDECREGEEEDGENEEGREAAEDQDEDDETGPVDLSVFKGSTLPVSCGSFTGVLHKDRFASGRCGKSIRTEEHWFTPEEFVRQDSTLVDGYWKKDILCHGKMINYLLEKKFLGVHSLLCGCRLCSAMEQDQEEQDNDDECFICNKEGNLVCCDECPRSFHHQCHLPAVQEDNLGEKWMCTFCVLKTTQEWWHTTGMTEEEALNSPISQYTMNCEYLLLCMYKEDTQQVFTEDPRPTVAAYSRFISKPMWLNKVKEKLQSRDYKTVGQFVSDIRLIFHNCHIFNRGNVFDTMGSRLSEMFEREFQTIYKIQ